MLTAKRLRELLIYNPETGAWKWRVNRPGGRRARAGDVAGYRLKTGYWFICVERERFLGHRLAFLYMTGRWPDDQVDHIDRNPGNDRWRNLRQSTQSENMMNSLFLGRRSVGRLRGTKRVSANRWMARINKNGESVYLGCFPTEQAAHSAYCVAAKQIYGKFVRGVVA